MGIIAWIVLGLGAGLLANMVIPGRRSQGLLNPARRRAGPRGHDSGTAVLVRAEKRLYLGELPLAAEPGRQREQPPL
jgi:hypothetical protein